MSQYTLPRCLGVSAVSLAWVLGACAQTHIAAQQTTPTQPVGQATSGGVAKPVVPSLDVSQRTMSELLQRIQNGSRHPTYVGTFVVSTPGRMSSARIWHVCQGDQQLERVETLTGTPRTTLRHNNQVLTLMPQSRVAVLEKRDTLGLFSELGRSADAGLAQFYRVKALSPERVAGVHTDAVELQAQDTLRFGYRLWLEQKTGLVVKLQTLDAQGRVLEQSAFSELQMDAPVSAAQLSQMMTPAEGYRTQTPDMAKTTAEKEGWVLKNAVSGFRPVSCVKRHMPPGQDTSPHDTLQWIFSDGLASVSVFIDPFDASQHTQHGVWTQGATSTLAVRKGDWWLTLVGEVPPQTLVVFAQALERRK